MSLHYYLTRLWSYCPLLFGIWQFFSFISFSDPFLRAESLLSHPWPWNDCFRCSSHKWRLCSPSPDHDCISCRCICCPETLPRSFSIIL